MSALNRVGATLRTAGAAVKTIAQRIASPAFRERENFAAAVSATQLEPDTKRALIARGLLGQTPQAAIRYAADIRDACFAASRMGDPEATKRVPQWVRSNVPLANVREDLLRALAEASENVELITTVPDQAGAFRSGLSAERIYANRAAAAKANNGTPAKKSGKKKKRR